MLDGQGFSSGEYDLEITESLENEKMTVHSKGKYAYTITYVCARTRQRQHEPGVESDTGMHAYIETISFHL